MAFQLLRGPAIREAILDFYRTTAGVLAGNVTPEIWRKLASENGVVPDDEEVARIVAFLRNGSGYRLDVARDERPNLHLQMAFPAMVDVCESLLVRRWQLLTFDDPVLLTGDEPVALVGASRHPGETLGVGNAHEVVMATDPNHALVLVRPDRSDAELRRRGTPPMARLVNLHVAFGCHRFIVVRPGTDPLRGIRLARKAPAVVVRGNAVQLRPHPPAVRSAERKRARRARRL